MLILKESCDCNPQIDLLRIVRSTMLEEPIKAKKTQKKKYDPFARKKGYLFSPRKLFFIARAASKLKTDDIEEKFAYIISRLKEEYPGHIEYDHKWVLNNAGGANWSNDLPSWISPRIYHNIWVFDEK